MTVLTILLLIFYFAGFCAALYNMFYSMLHREGINRALWILCNFAFAAWLGFQLIVNITQLN